MENTVSISSQPSELRHGTRTHLMVIATLCWEAGSTPVYVRNMSVRGALIEAPNLPKAGSLVILKRGSLEVGGRIAWASSRQAGLAFDAPVGVADWMVRQANVHQDRIDEIVAELRAAKARNEQPNVSAMGPDNPAAIEAELAHLRSDLVQLGNGLAADVILVATHPEIQLIDIALQHIERIVEALGRAGPTGG